MSRLGGQPLVRTAAAGYEEKQRLLLQENPVLRLELMQDVLSENGLLDNH
jgi:hypothetical protein